MFLHMNYSFCHFRRLQGCDDIFALPLGTVSHDACLSFGERDDGTVKLVAVE